MLFKTREFELRFEARRVAYRTRSLSQLLYLVWFVTLQTKSEIPNLSHLFLRHTRVF